MLEIEIHSATSRIRVNRCRMCCVERRPMGIVRGRTNLFDCPYFARGKLIARQPTAHFHCSAVMNHVSDGSARLLHVPICAGPSSVFACRSQPSSLIVYLICHPCRGGCCIIAILGISRVRSTMTLRKVSPRLPLTTTLLNALLSTFGVFLRPDLSCLGKTGPLQSSPEDRICIKPVIDERH